MAIKYTKWKSKKFKLQKEAKAYAKKIKDKNKSMKIRIDVNHLPSNPAIQSWEAIIYRGEV